VPDARGKTRRLGQKGQALVELALVMPILILILMGIVDFGRVYHGYLATTNAAREAARLASLGGTDSLVTETAVLTAAPLPAHSLVVSISPSPAERYSGNNVVVEVRHSLQIITPIMQAFLPSPFQVTGRAVMKIQ
jgi:Flp pilus assembly protein TadG